MSAASDVQIGQMALALCGSKSNIESFNERSVEARTCKLFYDKIRRQLLARVDWGFANRTEYLGLAPEDPTGGWAFRYLFPSDCITFRGVKSPLGDNKPNEPHAIEYLNGRKTILCNVPQARGRWTTNITDTTIFSDLFTDAAAHALAIRLCPKTTADKQTLETLKRDFQQIIYTAGQVDANEDQEEEESDPDWITRR